MRHLLPVLGLAVLSLVLSAQSARAVSGPLLPAAQTSDTCDLAPLS